jgi:hypothetical protein
MANISININLNPGGTATIGKLTIQSDHDTVTWKSGDPNVDFRIWFPLERDPLEVESRKPDPHMSDDGELTRRIKKLMRRGNHEKFPYCIYLPGENKMVEGTNSPPEMEIV